MSVEELLARLDDAVNALERIAVALERLVDYLIEPIKRR